MGDNNGGEESQSTVSSGSLTLSSEEEENMQSIANTSMHSKSLPKFVKMEIDQNVNPIHLIVVWVT